MAIRVLRLLEYTYASLEIMEQDMAKWHVPQQGIVSKVGYVIKSAVTEKPHPPLAELVEWARGFLAAQPKETPK